MKFILAILSILVSIQGHSDQIPKFCADLIDRPIDFKTTSSVFRLHYKSLSYTLNPSQNPKPVSSANASMEKADEYYFKDTLTQSAEQAIKQTEDVFLKLKHEVEAAAIGRFRIVWAARQIKSDFEFFNKESLDDSEIETRSITLKYAMFPEYCGKFRAFESKYLEKIYQESK